MANHQDNYTSNFEGQDPAGDAGLSLFVNYAENTYRPSGSDTSVYIPTVEKVASSGANIQVTIAKILAAGGYPVLVYGSEEYQYITTGGTPSKYVFMCLSDFSTLKRVEVNVSDGTISASSSTIGGVTYIDRSADNIFTKIASTISHYRLPVITDNGDLYQLSSVGAGAVRFTRVDEDDESIHILSISVSDTITETVVQGTEILKITKATPEASGLTEAEYAAISSAKIACLYYGSGSTSSYAYIQSFGNSTTFIHQTSTGYDIFAVAPVPTPVDPLDPDSELHHVVTKTSYTYGSSAMTMRNFEAVDATDTVNTHAAFPLGNDEFWVMEDWDGGWNNPNYYVMVAPSDTDNNCVVRFENVTTSYFTSGYPIEIWNHSKNAQLTPLDGSITAMKADCSYEIRIYGDKYYCCEVWNAQNAPVTDAELQYAITTLRSRTVFVIDVGEVSGQVNLNPNGTAGFLGTLFSPYMDFDLSSDTSVVFDVEQMGNAGDMTNFVIAIYEFNATTGEFNWVANTGDLSTLLDVDDRRLGLHHAKLQHLSVNAKLLGGKIYYAVACGHWNGWAFAGNTFATTLHSSVTPAFQCDNRSSTVDPATLGTGSYSKLYATDQSDPTKVDYSGISGNRMFIAFTNATLSI